MAMFRCETMPYQKMKNHNMVPLLQKARLKAVYLFDHDSQIFTNLARQEKQPLALRGDSDGVDASDPPLVTTPSNHFEVGAGQHFKIGAVNYHFDSTGFKPVAHVLKIKFLQFPAPGQREPIYTFLTDKTIEFVLGYDNKITMGSGTSKFTSPSINFALNTWYYLRFTLARMAYDERYFDCSASIQVEGIPGADYGGSLACKRIFYFF